MCSLREHAWGSFTVVLEVYLEVDAIVCCDHALPATGCFDGLLRMSWVYLVRFGLSGYESSNNC